MSVSLAEVIEAAGYDIETRDDAQWLLSKKSEFEELCDDAEAFLERLEEEENEQS